MCSLLILLNIYKNQGKTNKIQQKKQTKRLAGEKFMTKKKVAGTWNFSND